MDCTFTTDLRYEGKTTSVSSDFRRACPGRNHNWPATEEGENPLPPLSFPLAKRAGRRVGEQRSCGHAVADQLSLRRDKPSGSGRAGNLEEVAFAEPAGTFEDAEQVHRAPGPPAVAVLSGFAGVCGTHHLAWSSAVLALSVSRGTAVSVTRNLSSPVLSGSLSRSEKFGNVKLTQHVCPGSAQITVSTL